MKILHLLELVLSKNYFNLTKIFVLRLFKIVANLTACFKLEQRSFMKFLMAEKCKPCEIREEYVICMEKHCLVKCFESKRQWKHEVETHWVFGKEKILGTVVSNEGHAVTVLWHERTHLYWFPWKRWNCKQCFLLPISKAKFTLFLEWPS